MAAPKGNQYAVGNPNSGCPPKYDLEKEAQDLLEWCKKEDSLALYWFCRDKPYTSHLLDEFRNRSEVFAQAYSKAKELVRQNCEKAVSQGKYSQKIWDRYATMRDKQLRDHEREEKRFEAELKLKEAQVKQDTLTQFLEEISDRSK